MVISSEVETQEIIEHTAHEWAQLNGMWLQVKDLQFIKSETNVTFFKVSTATPKDVILADLSKILIAAQDMAEADSMDLNDYHFFDGCGHTTWQDTPCHKPTNPKLQVEETRSCHF
jgi:hypothetical protein